MTDRYRFLYQTTTRGSHTVYIPDGDIDNPDPYIPDGEGDNNGDIPPEPPSYWWIWPALSTVISGYQYTENHHAIDIAASSGDPIMAPTQGKVIKAESDPGGYGNYVMIETAKDGYKVILAHLSEILVNVGDIVGAGDVIGKAGSTGRSTGPHLHLEIRTAGGGGWINPFDIFGSSPTPGTPIYGNQKGYDPGNGSEKSTQPGGNKGIIIETPIGDITLPFDLPDIDPMDIAVFILGLGVLGIGLVGFILAETGKTAGSSIGAALGSGLKKVVKS